MVIGAAKSLELASPAATPSHVIVPEITADVGATPPARIDRDQGQQPVDFVTPEVGVGKALAPAKAGESAATGGRSGTTTASASQANAQERSSTANSPAKLKPRRKKRSSRPEPMVTCKPRARSACDQLVNAPARTWAMVHHVMAMEEPLRVDSPPDHQVDAYLHELDKFCSDKLLTCKIVKNNDLSRTSCATPHFCT